MNGSHVLLCNTVRVGRDIYIFFLCRLVLSMRSIIFANYLARDTMRLSPTLDVEHRWDNDLHVTVQIVKICHNDVSSSPSFSLLLSLLLSLLRFHDSHVRFLGNLELNLWDCGGQDAFYESYFEMQVVADCIWLYTNVLCIKSLPRCADLIFIIQYREIRSFEASLWSFMCLILKAMT